MSKLKIIDMNKQLIDKSKQTVARMEALQATVQAHLATLKRIEAELLQVVRLRRKKSASASSRMSSSWLQRKRMRLRGPKHSRLRPEAQPARQMRRPPFEKDKAPRRLRLLPFPQETVQKAPSTTQDTRGRRRLARRGRNAWPLMAAGRQDRTILLEGQQPAGRNQACFRQKSVGCQAGGGENAVCADGEARRTEQEVAGQSV